MFKCFKIIEFVVVVLLQFLIELDGFFNVLVSCKICDYIYYFKKSMCVFSQVEVIEKVVVIVCVIDLVVKGELFDN